MYINQFACLNWWELADRYIQYQLGYSISNPYTLCAVEELRKVPCLLRNSTLDKYTPVVGRCVALISALRGFGTDFVMKGESWEIQV